MNQVLRWRGLTAVEINAGWRDEDCDPEHATVYAVPVRMTRQDCGDGSFRLAERPGAALFEGGGDWGAPGDPDHPPRWLHFNSCRLTAEGERVARRLWEHQPEYCN